MGFKTGLAVGLAVGYTLGARAGRDRYEQIKAGAARAVASEPAHRIAEQGKALLDKGAEPARQAAAAGLSKVAAQLLERRQTEPASPETATG